MVKQKSCKQCKTKFTPTQPLQQVCSFKCSIDYARINQAKKAKKDWVKEKAERKEKIMTLSEWKGLLQIKSNSIVTAPTYIMTGIKFTCLCTCGNTPYIQIY